MKCDPVTGTCALPETPDPERSEATEMRLGLVVRYIGDPMCSWCWGLSPVVEQLAAYCDQEGLAFSLTVGGLRAGGGDPWDASFRAFLRNEWAHIAQVTGQPFGFSLLDLPQFDYDTEPACRAVVVAQQMLAQQGTRPSAILPFFRTVQEKFYVEGKDPKNVSFYREACDAVKLNFETFEAVFPTPAARRVTHQQFVQCRQWGVRSFPTLLFEANGKSVLLNAGFTQAAPLLERLAALVSRSAQADVSPPADGAQHHA